MNGLNVLIAEKQHRDETKLKLNLDTDLAVRLRSLGAALAEHESEMKKTADIRNVLGTVNPIAVQDMIAPAMMIKNALCQ